MKKILLLFVISILGCEGLNSPYYPPGPANPYGGAYGGGYGYPSYEYDRDRYYDERRRYEDEREDLKRERRRLEEERRKYEEAQRTPAPKPESCPPGFRPSEIKCTKEERRRGCKDMRMPSGLGCVKR